MAKGNVHLSQFLRNTSLDALDLGRTEAGKGAFVLRTTEAGTHGTLELGEWGAHGRFAFTTVCGHGCRGDCVETWSI